MLTREQKDARIGKLTSSVVAGALGLSDYMTPIGAKMAVLGKGDFSGSKATERGNALEKIVLEYPASTLGLCCEPAPFRVHSEGWAADSCDALYYRAPYIAEMDLPVAIGEGKTASLGASGSWGSEGTDEVPVNAWVQAYWHLIHWPDVDTCYVPVLVGGYTFEFRLYEIHRNAEYAGQIFDAARKWHHDYIVRDGTPPALKGDDENSIVSLHSRATGPSLQALPGSDIDLLVRGYEETRGLRERYEEEESVARTEIKRLLGEHSGAQGEGWKISYKNNKDSQRTHWENLAIELLGRINSSDEKEAIVNKYTQTTPGPRVFRPTFTRGKK